MAATVLEKYTLDGKAQSVQGYKFIAWNVSATQLFSVFTGFALSAAISEDGGVFTNETTAANNDTTNDVTLMPTPTAANDRYYAGYSDTFDEVEINVSTAGAGTYTLDWEYSRGSGDWGTLVVTDDTSDFKTSGINTVSFTPPDDWRTDTVNSQGPFYYIRAVSDGGTQTTQPLGQRLYIDPGRIAQQTVETQSHSVAAFVTTTTTRLPIKLRTVLYGYDFEQRTLNITEATSQDFFPAVNANIVDSLSTVTARTGITINHTTDTVTLDGTGISPVNTTQKLYDRLQYEGFNDPQEPFVDLMATVDGQNFNPFEYDLVVSGFLFDGENKSIAFATGKDLTISAAGGDVQDLAVTGDVVTGTGFNQTTFDNLDVTGDVDLTNAGAGTYSLVGCTWGSVTSTVSGITLNLDTNSSITTNNSPANITIVSGAVSTTVKVLDSRDNSNLQNARVILEASDGTGDLPFEDSVSITRVGSVASVSHTSHGLADGNKVVIRGANQSEYNGIKTITNVTTNAYDYTVSGTPTTPATGTIISTGAVLEGLTDVNGEITDSRSWTNPQPVTGRASKATTSPIFKDAALTGTISTTAGLSITQALIFDEG